MEKKMKNTAPETEYRTNLLRFLTDAYGFRAEDICPAKRGFYGETWDIRTESGKLFLKIDYWEHHKKGFRDSLPIIRYMTDSGISFIPKIISTKDGHLCSSFRQGTAAVFEHVPGELSENYSTAQLYSCLAKVYRLRTEGLELEAENFGSGRLETFRTLRSLPALPAKIKTALAEKETDIVRYMERLQRFSAVCKGNLENFHITHGDAGGNCILNGDQLFLVDWDSCLLAPIERDAWIYICDRSEMERIHFILAENGIDYALDQNRLCYYCYDFFFYYLNEYLESLIEAVNQGQKEKIAQGLMEYLTDCWIYKRLEAADQVR